MKKTLLFLETNRILMRCFKISLFKVNLIFCVFFTVINSNAQKVLILSSSGLDSITRSTIQPQGALDVVSYNSGFLSPRMTEMQLQSFLMTLNLADDVTGGVHGPAFSKKGMQIECVDCVSMDGSTQGVTVKIYPNASLTSWIAKKLW